MDQTIVNWMLAGFGGLIGFLLNAVWQAVKELKTADERLASQVSDLKVLVAGDYVRHEMFDRLSDAIFTKLDRIENKLDGKADKS